MRRRVLPGATLLFVVACAAPEPAVVEGGVPVPDGAQEASVVSITDGDTLRLRGRGTGPVPGDVTKVRVLLIDTPEVFGEQECFGEEASERLEQLLPEGSSVHVQADDDLFDRYERMLLHVWNDDGVNVGEQLVAEGYATVLQVDPNEMYLDAFQAREREARQADRGLWAECT